MEDENKTEIQEPVPSDVDENQVVVEPKADLQADGVAQEEVAIEPAEIAPQETSSDLLSVVDRLGFSNPETLVTTPAQAEPSATSQSINEEAMLDLRDSNPVAYDKLRENALRESITKEVRETISSELVAFDNRVKSMQALNDVEATIVKQLPDYNDANSQSRKDIDYVAEKMGGKNNPLIRLGAASLVIQSKQGATVSAARVQGARQEAARTVNAEKSVGSNSTPQPGNIKPDIDPYYQKFAGAFGVDPAKAQENHNRMPQA